VTTPNYDAVIFDKDGVLVERTSRALLDRTTREAFAAVGVAQPDDEDVRRVDRDHEALRAICERHGVDPERFWDHHERERIDAQRAAMERGHKPTYDDVETLRDLSVPLGIVSNNQHGTVEAAVETFGLADLFETHYGRDHSIEGFRRRKPDPHYLRQAMADLGTDRPLYVGDSRVDVAAAHRAGADSAFIRRDHREGYELDRDPTHEIEGLDELAGILDGSGSSEA